MSTLEAIREVADGLMPAVMEFAKTDPAMACRVAKDLSPVCRCHQAFSPVYVFDVCLANCRYCGYRKSNRMERTVLTEVEARAEAAFVAGTGCTAAYVLGGSLTAWDSPWTSGLSRQGEFAARGLRAVRDAKLFPVLEMSPFSRNELEQLAAIAGPGRYVLFQETYDVSAYLAEHDDGGDTLRYKGRPEERVTQVATALAAGWRQVGVGAVLGMSPNLWLDVASVIAHARMLLDLGAELVTISVPRLNPAKGAKTDARCSDDDFMRAVAIISILGRTYAPGRIQTVVTGRETPAMRDALAPLCDVIGVRGSTTPGGYTVRPDAEGGQFDLVDRRTLPEIREAFSARLH